MMTFHASDTLNSLNDKCLVAMELVLYMHMSLCRGGVAVRMQNLIPTQLSLQ